ncbi:hypothetical protein [Oscillatoria sp. HE19RPO]|nr:hypothetical protein [Oscillatoria sp. HE19RPO]
MAIADDRKASPLRSTPLLEGWKGPLPSHTPENGEPGKTVRNP